MKREVFRVDKHGYIINKFHALFDERGNCLEELSNDIVTIQPTNGLYRAKWTGVKWIEDMTQEEIEALNNQPQPLSEIELLQIKLQKAEEATASTSLFQQDLLELLIEMGVI